jgi:DNA-binding GntR family transcriptional regulator
MPELIRDQIYQKIKREILSGVYQQGEQLSANQLAGRNDISATPVREALNALEQEGFIEVIPRIGFFVARVTSKDVRDIYEFRIIIEGASAEMAAVRITDKELAYIAEIPSDYVMGDTESYLEYLKNNREFHLSIAKSSRNQFLAKTVEMILDQTQRMVFLGIGSSEHTDAILQAHPRLVAALRKRDPEESRRTMIEGIVAARDAAIQQIIHGSSVAVHPSETAQTG